MDRGYPAHDIFHALIDEGVDFLVRVQDKTFTATKHLREAGAVDEDFILEVPRLGDDGWTELELRYVRIDRPNGESMHFYTSLRRSEVSRRQIDELYHLRWSLEEHYKLGKSLYRHHWEPRSKTVDGVIQEIYAHILFLAIGRLLVTVTARATGRSLNEVSQKAAILGVAAYLTRLFLAQPWLARHGIHDLLVRISRSPERPRPGRSYPRRSFRPAPPWNPRGHRTG